MPIYLVLHIDDRAEELLAQVRLEAIHQLIVVIHDERVSTLEADYYTRRQVAVLLLTTDLLQLFDHILIECPTRVRNEAQPTDTVWLLLEFESFPIL